MKVRHKTFEKIRTNSLPPIINLEKSAMTNNFYKPDGGINRDIDTYFQVNKKKRNEQKKKFIKEKRMK